MRLRLHSGLIAVAHLRIRPYQRYPIHQAELPSYQKPCKFRPKNLGFGFGRFWPKTSVSVLVDKTVTTLFLAPKKYRKTGITEGCKVDMSRDIAFSVSNGGHLEFCG